MKLAMAVGDNRHYVVNTIAPRHFIQTAAAAGIGQVGVMQIFSEVISSANAALETVLQSLPAEFPASVADSISNGFSVRLRLLLPK